MNNHLPAGLRDRNHEFFVHGASDVFFLNEGRVLSMAEIHGDLFESIEQQIPGKKQTALTDMGITDRIGRVAKFLACNYGSFDNKADMVDGVLQEPEYVPCPLRGACKQEGILCDKLKTATGRLLSPKEVDIIRRIARGELDKEIAGNLNIALSTVTTHTKNIRVKTGLSRKCDIATFAHQKQLI